MAEGGSKAKKPWYKRWWGMLIIGILAFYILAGIGMYFESQKSPEQREAEDMEMLQNDIKTMLSFDGVDNDDFVKIEKIEESKVSELSECVDSKNLMVAVGVDITSKTRGAIDKFVGDDFTWGLDAARKTLKKLYTDYAHKAYPEKVGLTRLIFIKTPESTKDDYGNMIEQQSVLIGTMTLCHATAMKINWNGIDNTQLESLVFIDWQGTRGTGLGDKLEKTARALEELQVATESLRSLS